MTLTQLSKILDATTDAKTLFGINPDKEFQRLAKMCHPDLHPKQKALAEKTFKRLNELHQQVNGKSSPAVLPKLGKWVVTAPITAGDVADVYRVESAKGSGVLKLARDEADNDLMDREVQALKALANAKEETKYQKYIPSVLDKFSADGRRINVVSEVKDGYTLPQLAAVCDLSEFRHIVWMFNRLLTVLGFAHRQGLVHGAVTPEHLLYIPAEHGLVLIDWTASTVMVDGNKIPYMSESRENLYPPEVRRGQFYTGTDIFMAARCMQQVIVGGTIPKQFKPIFDYCLAGSPHSRPDDAWKLQHEWKETARNLYGPPKFVELKPITV